jgi:hypothetical protein
MPAALIEGYAPQHPCNRGDGGCSNVMSAITGNSCAGLIPAVSELC